MKFLFKNEAIDYDFFNKNGNDTILFLHGWGGNKFSFSSTANLLKYQHNVLSITMPTTSPTTSVWNLFDYSQLVENIISLHNIEDPIIICHSFGFRVAMLLNKKIKIKKIIITGGAGPKKNLNFLKKIIKNNDKIVLKNKNLKEFYKKIASSDYLSLCPTNKETFKNIVNLNTNCLIKFNCPMLLFWGKNDKDTPQWVAKKLNKINNSKLIITNGDHFTYLKEVSHFNHEILNFITKKN